MNAFRIIRFTITLAITLGLAAPAGFTALAQAPVNDNFADALLITETPFDDSQTTSEATTEVGEPFPSCTYGSSPGQTVWYAYTPSSNGIAQGYIDKNFEAFLAVYTGLDLANLSEIGCWNWVGGFSFQVEEGMIYYLQIGSMGGSADWMNLHLDLILPPPNDNFANATEITTLGEFYVVNNSVAGVEPGEPDPSCGYGERTVWFRYTPADSGSVTADPSNWWNIVAVYTGSGLGDLTEIGCRYYGDPLPIQVEAGTTYYFQVGSNGGWDYGELSFQLYETPPPSADFWFAPEYPSAYDTIDFCDNSFDPVDMGFSEFWWDFGDGTTSTDNCAPHPYVSDGDYTVFHNITTSNGRTDPDGSTKTVSIRTHDVAITRVTAPLSASARQTRAITVDIKNTRYPENVRVVLYKSVVGGFQEIAYTTQYVPVRPGNRTTRFTFNYTFTPEDAALGKVTFKAIAELQDYRDVFPADNEAVSTPPTKVSKK